MLGSLLRWLLVGGGALAGSYGGRILAATLRGEPVEPLLRFDRATLLRPDMAPGIMAAEIAGRILRLGPWSAALVAAAGAAAAVLAEGPLTRPDADDDGADAGRPNPVTVTPLT